MSESKPVTLDVRIGDQTMSLECSEAALEAGRFDFNPGGKPKVALITALSAALITACEDLKGSNPVTRWAQLAITHTETGAMFAVKGATYDG